MRVTSLWAWIRTGCVLACACALALLALGHAFACSPHGGDRWYTLSVVVSTESLPRGFALRASRVEGTGNRRCVLEYGQSLDGFEPDWLKQFARNDTFGDGRPAQLAVPADQQLSFEVHCDRRRYVALGRHSYRRPSYGRLKAPDTKVNHLELDLAAVGHLITTRSWTSGPVSEDLYIDRRPPAAQFCTMSAERIFDERGAVDATVFGHGSISLVRLAGILSPLDIEDTTQLARPPKTFRVFLDCYRSMTRVQATIRYALNPSYDPHRHARSVEACRDRPM